MMCIALYLSEKRLRILLDIFNTILTDKSALVELNVGRISAENAGRLIFLKDDFVFIDKDLKTVLALNIHCVSDFDGKNYSSYFVDRSYNTGRFHGNLLNREKFNFKYFNIINAFGQEGIRRFRRFM